MEERTVYERGRPRGFLGHLTGLYLSPGAEFPAILRKPRPIAPLLALVAVNILFTAVWSYKVDAVEFMRAQMEESGRADRIPPERREEIIETQARYFKPIAWGSTLVFTPVLILAVAALYLFVFRFLFGGELGFAQSFAVVAWSFFAVGLVTSPLTLLTMALKQEWNMDPRIALQANLSLVLDKESVSKPLYDLAQSLDLFSFWMLWLLSVGYGAATGRSAASAAAGVVGLWAIYVLGKAGLSLLF